MAPVPFPHGRRQPDAAGRRHECRRVPLRLCDAFQRHDPVDQAVFFCLGGGDPDIFIHQGDQLLPGATAAPGGVHFQDAVPGVPQGLRAAPHLVEVPRGGIAWVVVTQQRSRLTLDDGAGGHRQGGRAGAVALEQGCSLSLVSPQHGADLRTHSHVSTRRVHQDRHLVPAGGLQRRPDVHGGRDVSKPPPAQDVGAVIVPKLSAN